MAEPEAEEKPAEEGAIDEAVEGEEGDEDDEDKPQRKYPVDPKIASKMRESFPFFVRKGAKSKTEFPDKEAGTLLRCACINPSEAQIEAIMASAKAKEKNTTSKGHYEYENFEQRVAEYMFLNKGCFERHSEEKLLEAMNTFLEGKLTVDAANFKKVTMTKGHPFSEDESTKMLRIAKDKDTGLIHTDEYAQLLAKDGIPPPPDPLEPFDESFR